MYERNGPLVLGFSYTEHGFLSNLSGIHFLRHSAKNLESVMSDI